jgi:hypothetical protein
VNQTIGFLQMRDLLVAHQGMATLQKWVKDANMKTNKKFKSHASRKETALPIGMQRTHQVSKSSLTKGNPTNTFTRDETAGPDADNVPGMQNPQAVQGGLGPTNQDGEGERQNDQLAALEEIEPEG